LGQARENRDARMATVAAGPVPPTAPLHLFGAEWHRGQGAKERCDVERRAVHGAARVSSAAIPPGRRRAHLV
jgi:hypothetical protein